MSDNVRDELAQVLLRCGVMFDGTQGHRTRLTIAAAVLAHLAGRGMVVLDPDGEPLDVRPALRALGHITIHQWNDGSRLVARADLAHYRITGPLASACLAAAETEPS